MPDSVKKLERTTSSNSIPMDLSSIEERGVFGKTGGNEPIPNLHYFERECNDAQSQNAQRYQLTPNYSAYKDAQKLSPQPIARYVNSHCVMYDYFHGDINREVDEHFRRALNSSVNSKEISAPMSQRNFPASFWNAQYIPNQCYWSSDFMKAIDYSIHALYGKVADSPFKSGLHPPSSASSPRLNLPIAFNSVYTNPWRACASALNSAFRPQTYSQQAINAVTVVSTSDLYRLTPAATYPLNRYSSIIAQHTLPAVHIARQRNVPLSSLNSGMDLTGTNATQDSLNLNRHSDSNFLCLDRWISEKGLAL